MSNTETIKYVKKVFKFLDDIVSTDWYDIRNLAKEDTQGLFRECIILYLYKNAINNEASFVFNPDDYYQFKKDV